MSLPLDGVFKLPILLLRLCDFLRLLSTIAGLGAIFVRSICFAAAALLAAQLAGCASVIEGETQAIFVDTGSLKGANCTLTNKRGAWSVTSPGTVAVKRSDSVLKTRCVKEGWQDGTSYVASKVPTSAMVGMMLPYVGLLNSAVDASSGAANQYPKTIFITMKPAPADGASTGEQH